MKLYRNLKAFLILGLVALSLSAPARGASSFSVDIAAGIPHLLSFELSYWGLGPFVAGVGFGSLPVNRVLQNNIPIDNRAVSGGYTLLPTANYSFIAISAFLRYFPFNGNKGSGTFLELNVARWKFNANVVGDLREDGTGSVVGSALNGTIDFQQPLASVIVGYRSMLTANLFLHAGVGATYLFTPSHTTVINGAISSVLPLASQPTIDSFEQAKTDVDNQVNNGVNALETTTKVIPAIWFNMGWLF